MHAIPSVFNQSWIPHWKEADRQLCVVIKININFPLFLIYGQPLECVMHPRVGA